MMRTKTSSSSSPATDILRFISGIFLSLLLGYGLWSTFNSSGSLILHSKNTLHSTTTDQVNSLNCGGWRSPPGTESRCDPSNPTFYDDPTLRYSISKPISDWDRKRQQWLKYHPSFTHSSSPRVLIVTGSQPKECPHPKGDHLLLRFFKNKVDYVRRHPEYHIFYNTALLHPKMTGFWAKIQTIRSAMLAHPQSEWIFWVDSDAAFTDMDYKVPLQRYKHHNLVVHGWEDEIYNKKSWVGLNAGVFLIRNCQWSMDFLRSWAKMGPQTEQYNEWGRKQRETLSNKAFEAADDQSGLVYLLLKEKDKWGDKIYIENEYALHGYWIGIVRRFENISDGYDRTEAKDRTLRRRHGEIVSEHYGELWEPYLRKVGYGDDAWTRPFITHFTGCQPCNGKHSPEYKPDDCWDGMTRALNFADNQVLRNYGYMHSSLLDASVTPVATKFFDED